MQNPTDGDNANETNNQSLINSMNVANNIKNLNHCRNLAGIIAGITAGIFSFTSISGLIVFAVINVLMSATLFIAHQPNPSHYMLTPKQYFTQNMTGGLMVFVLFWVLAYDIVNIFV